MEKRWRKKQNMKKKGKTNIPGGGSLGFLGGEGVKMSLWGTGTRPPILDKIKQEQQTS